MNGKLVALVTGSSRGIGRGIGLALLFCNSFDNMEGRGEVTRSRVSLQDLRRRIYAKAKAEPDLRFCGLYIHIGALPGGNGEK